MPEYIFMKLDMHIIAPQLPSGCVSVCVFPYHCYTTAQQKKKKGMKTFITNAVRTWNPTAVLAAWNMFLTFGVMEMTKNHHSQGSVCLCVRVGACVCVCVCICGSFPHERQSTDVHCYATACWFHFHGNQQYVTTQQYCNAITSGVFSWSVHTQQFVAMQRMTQLWSDQSGFQWVGPEPIKGMHKPSPNGTPCGGGLEYFHRSPCES
jgi:hypothetical protein